MVPYKKDGHQYILIANTARGVMKLKADNLETYRAIESPEVPNPQNANISGVPYDTMADLKGVTQLSQIDDTDVVVLSKGTDAVNISTIALP
jgi:hypothetical protein